MSSFVVRIQVGNTIQEYVRPARSIGQMKAAIRDNYPGLFLVDVYKL